MVLIHPAYTPLNPKHKGRENLHDPRGIALARVDAGGEQDGGARMPPPPRVPRRLVLLAGDGQHVHAVARRRSAEQAPIQEPHVPLVRLRGPAHASQPAIYSPSRRPLVSGGLAPQALSPSLQPRLVDPQGASFKC